MVNCQMLTLETLLSKSRCQKYNIYLLLDLVYIEDKEEIYPI